MRTMMLPLLLRDQIRSYEARWRVQLRKRDNNQNRKRVRALKRRADYLEKRIKDYNSSNGNPSRDIAERDALLWSLGIVQDWIKADPLFEFDWSGTQFTEEATLDDVVDLVGAAGEFEGRRVEILGARLLADFYPPTIRLLMRYLEEGEHAKKDDGVLVPIGE